MLNPEDAVPGRARGGTQSITLPGESMPSHNGGGQGELVLDYDLLLDKGLSRERNEDRCGAFEPQDPPLRAERGRLFVVADGMGGHAGGDIAAETALRTIKETYYERGWTGPAPKLRAAFLSANEAILDLASRDARLRGMGAASVAIAVVQDRAYVAHLGDCRAYLIRAGAAQRMTTDHSWVQERIDAHRLTEEEARAHPHRNMLTKALGAEVEGEPDVGEYQVAPGDTMILCSDGLWGVAGDQELARAVAENHDAVGTARALVDLALARGGPDNISVVVVRVVPPSTDAPTTRLSLRGE